MREHAHAGSTVSEGLIVAAQTSRTRTRRCPAFKWPLIWVGLTLVLWIVPNPLFYNAVYGGGAKNLGYNFGFFAPLNNRFDSYDDFPEFLGIWSLSAENHWSINTGGFLLTALLMIAGSTWCWRRHRSERRFAAGACPACGYDLRGGAGAGCPECGWQRSPVDGARKQQGSSE